MSFHEQRFPRLIRRGTVATLIALMMNGGLPIEADAKPLQHVKDRKLQQQVGRIIRAAKPFPDEGLNIIESEEDSVAGLDYEISGNIDLEKIRSKDVRLVRKQDGSIQAMFDATIDIQNQNPLDPLTADEESAAKDGIRTLAEADLDRVFREKTAELGQTIDIQVNEAQ